MTETSTLPDYQFAGDNGPHGTSFSTDNSSGSPDAWAEEGSTELSVNACQGSFIHSSLRCINSPATFEYHTIASAHDDYFPNEVTPKVEELDDVEELELIMPSDAGTENKASSVTGVPANVPRKRGRPRKHPLPAPNSHIKVTKGRSKTGCITCRRRKKKCDETKPAYIQPPPSAVAYR